MPYAKKYRKNFKRRTPRRKTGMRSAMYKIAKQVQLRNSESKHHAAQWAHASLYHNSWIRPTQNLLYSGQGSGDTHRVGDDVFAKGVRLDLVFDQPADRPQTSFRVVVLRGHYTQFSSTTSPPLKTPSVNVSLIDHIDTEKCNVVFNKIYRNYQPNTDVGSDANYASKPTTFMRKIWIPLKMKKYTYDGNNGYHGKWDSYAVYVTAYDHRGDVTTDIVGGLTALTNFYFKDP